MDTLELGPNGGLVYCMNYIDSNFEWLVRQLEAFQDKYLLFDFPGQVELYTHETSVHKILEKLGKLNVRLSVVHLVDAHHCTDSSKFISVVLMSLASMVRLELPHINVLSKVDLMEQYGKLAYNLDYYTDVLDLRYLLNWLDAERLGLQVDEVDENGNQKLILDEDTSINESKTVVSSKFRRLNEALIDVIEDFSLVSFHPIQIHDTTSLKALILAIDKSNGYVFTSVDWKCAVAQDSIVDNEHVMDMQERFLGTQDSSSGLQEEMRNIAEVNSRS
ncbi:unnamed protein product [Albugo candida]|uniref:GPN-loop GTPase 2 n=1 Tax=Albugo candida TaxID=65357 RepID=A0A024G6H2_9STRA|nr:unnamed protein product [Albugo candida]|eukprot:CCI41885.1 unnamed protein product [Albugo candida]